MTNRITWTPEMREALRQLRSRGVPLYYCAEKIGVGYPAAVYEARRLGIAGRMNNGRTPGTEIAQGRKS
jgi:hypothetical protein